MGASIAPAASLGARFAGMPERTTQRRGDGTLCALLLRCVRVMFFQMCAWVCWTIDMQSACGLNKKKSLCCHFGSVTMFKFLTRGVCAVIVSTALLPAESPACCFCHCFDWCSKPAPAPTYAAAPVCAAPACNVCPQQVSYVPQTSFRTEYTCVPVTTCRPITTCDPCGGTQTVMQPVTTFVRRPVMVPVTTMRPVVTQVNFAAPSCPTCGGAAAAPY